MRARIFLILPMILTPLLASCEKDEQWPAVAAISAIQGRATPAERRDEIRRQFAVICPRPLSDEQLERAAAFIEKNRTREAIAIVRDLSRMDAETRVCRGMKTGA